MSARKVIAGVLILSLVLLVSNTSFFSQEAHASAQDVGGGRAFLIIGGGCLGMLMGCGCGLGLIALIDPDPDDDELVVLIMTGTTVGGGLAGVIAGAMYAGRRGGSSSLFELKDSSLSLQVPSPTLTVCGTQPGSEKRQVKGEVCLFRASF